jgi:ferredoxin
MRWQSCWRRYAPIYNFVSERIVSLTSGAFFAAAPAENLLSAAQRAHWLVRYGCRNGNCEACAATLLKGCVEQAGTIVDAAQAPQKILLCLCRAASDLQIELPGNPQHGSSEQARRYYARLNSVNRDDNGGAAIQLHITLPAGRRTPMYAGQYAMLEHNGELIRAEIDTLLSSGRELYLHCSANVALPATGYISVFCPLGYCYNAAASSLLILHDESQNSQAALLKKAWPNAAIFSDKQFDRLAPGRVFATVLACARDPRVTPAWYEQLLQQRIIFNEFRSDSAVSYRWSVCRQDNSGNRLIVETALSETAARNAVAEFERRGHKQLYWAEPIAPRP